FRDALLWDNIWALSFTTLLPLLTTFGCPILQYYNHYRFCQFHQSSSPTNNVTKSFILMKIVSLGISDDVYGFLIEGANSQVTLTAAEILPL
ncbi:4609_t:CDS:2, partial [Ambispora leptoticha]